MSKFIATLSCDEQPDDMQEFDQFIDCFNWAKNHWQRRPTTWLRIYDVEEERDTFWKLDRFGDFERVKSEQEVYCP